MNSTERDIGELKEQGRWMAAKIDKMDEKIDHLLAFKWRVLGASLMVAFLASVAVEIVRR